MEINKQVKVSILVATCNRPEMLKTCFKSLLNQKTETPYEIIILDQSDAEKQTILSSDRLMTKVVVCDFKNKSRALNLGVKLASADYIAVIDDDCIADKYWSDSLYKALRKEGRNFIITGQVVAGDKEEGAIHSRLHDAIGERIVFEKRMITPIFKLSGCNFGFHKNTYKNVGSFNEGFGPGSTFKSSDDNEWSYRALNSGFLIVYVPEATVIHRFWRNAKEDVGLMKDYGYAAGAFFKLIFETSKLDFLHHSVQLWWWLSKTILLSFNIHEITGHFYYGLFFCKGFFKYDRCISGFFDCVFVLSPGKYIGGAERYIQSLAKELRKQNNSNIVIAISHNSKFYLECNDNIPSVYLGDTLKESSIKLSRLIKDNQVAAVVSSGYHSSYLVFLARFKNLFRDRRSRFIDIKHGWITTSFPERFKTFLDKLVSIFYDFIILVNPSMKSGLWFIGKKKLVFIPSGISIESDFIHKRQRANPLEILLIGRLAEEKRFELVLDALYHISKDLWRLTIVGDGSKSDTLRQLAIRNNIHDRIYFAGYQENVSPFYQNADLLIISSVNEGCPIVALEAMTQRVLVLSTGIGYMTTLLNKNRGFLVDADITAVELSKKIKEITALDDRTKKQILNNAQLFVYKNHNLGRNLELFKNLISNQ